MNWLKGAVRELWGLFVEDGSFALAILIWIALLVFLLPAVLPDHWRGPVAFAGLAVILIENVVRSARKDSRRR